MRKKFTALAMVCLFTFVLVFSFTVSLMAGDYLGPDCCETEDPPMLGVYNVVGDIQWCDCRGFYDGGGIFTNPQNCPLWCPSGS